MPKLKGNAEEAAREAFRREVKACRDYRAMKQQDLADDLDLGPSAMSVLLSNPDKISAGRMRKIVHVLKPDPVVVLSLLGYTAKDIQAISK